MKDEHKGAIEVSVIFHEGQRMFAVPKQPAPVQGPDWKAEYLKSVESGCITLDELRETLAELEATNRQVEILSDALAKSRREVAAWRTWVGSGDLEDSNAYQTPPAQEFVCSTGLCHYKAQRQWVGLTDEDIQSIHDTYHKRMGPMEFARAIEAKSREMNT
jgi:hypothetical protein